MTIPRREPKWHEKVSKDFEDLLKVMRGYNLPALGPAFVTMDDTSIADALVAHRMLKLNPERAKDPRERRLRTIADTLRYDELGLTEFDWRSLPKEDRITFIKAKDFLQQLFAGLRPTYRAVFPSGETAESAKGFVDFVEKLRDGSQWRVSFDALPYATRILYNNPRLRAVVKERFRAVVPEWHLVAQLWWTEEQNKFRVFQRMFQACCTIQAYSRLSSVEKTAEKDRPISMEPLFNMMCQLSFAQDIRDALQRKLGYNLDYRPDLHRGLIRVKGKATIDFSNASNSCWMVVVRQLFPSHVVRRLEQLRSPITYFEGRFHHWNMLSPMGCGFTFEVLTCYLLAVATSFDSGATVFGDDVILQNDAAAPFTKFCEKLGWVVNEAKSFSTGSFRESCGAFASQDTGRYFISYDFKPIRDEVDAIVNCNKIAIILANGNCSPKVRETLARFWVRMVLRLPRVALRSYHDYPLTFVSGSQVYSGFVVVPHVWWRNIQKPKQTVMESLYSAMYHREVTLGTVYRRQLDYGTREGPVSPRILFAAYLRRGASYTPTIANTQRIVPETVVTPGERAVTQCPLLSVL